MIQINMEDVTTTYRGFGGCACGCGGDYFYTSGSTTDSWHTINDMGAKRRVNIMNKALATGDTSVTVSVFGDESCFELVTKPAEWSAESRVVRVYVKNGTEA